MHTFLCIIFFGDHFGEALWFRVFMHELSRTPNRKKIVVFLKQTSGFWVFCFLCFFWGGGLLFINF